MYMILSAAFYRPDNRADRLWQTMVKLVSVSDSPSLALEEGGNYGTREMLQRLEVEYNRLFVGPGHLCCPPYESVYGRDRPASEIGLLAGPAEFDVRRLYAQSGFRLSDTFKDYPDHIAPELEFMGHLCANESKSEGIEAEKWVAAQAEFMNRHLGTWVVKFADAVLAATPLPFYQAAAVLLKQFALDEASAFRAEG